MPTVTIHLLGVCSMAPAPPEKGVTSGPFRVAMPVSSRRQNAMSRRTGIPGYIPTHIPFVSAQREPWPKNAAVVLGGDRPADYTPPTKNKSSKTSLPWTVWLPVRERLKICPDGEYQPGDIDYEREGVRSVSNLADMRKIWSDRARFIESCDPLGPIDRVDATVLTQVLIPYGKVAGENPGDSQWDFKPAKPRNGCCHYDTLLRWASITFQVDSYVWISSQSLDDGNSLDSISLPISKNTDIVIGNTDFGEIVDHVNGMTPALDQQDNYEPGDSDFELHYTLLKKPDVSDPDDEFLPIPFKTPDSDKGLGPEDSRGWVKNCLVAFVQS